MNKKIKNYETDKNNKYQAKIKSDCETLSNAFNHLINVAVPNNYEKIVNKEPIKGTTFKLNHLKQYDALRECGINTHNVIDEAKKKCGRDLGYLFFEETFFGNKSYLELKPTTFHYL
jgi:hypothetical protein